MKLNSRQSFILRPTVVVFSNHPGWMCLVFAPFIFFCLFFFFGLDFWGEKKTDETVPILLLLLYSLLYVRRYEKVTSPQLSPRPSTAYSLHIESSTTTVTFKTYHYMMFHLCLLHFLFLVRPVTFNLNRICTLVHNSPCYLVTASPFA